MMNLMFARCLPKKSGEPKLEAKCVICKPAAVWWLNKAAGGNLDGLIESFLAVNRLSLIGEVDGERSTMRDCFDKILSIVKRDVADEDEDVPFLHKFSLFF